MPASSGTWFTNWKVSVLQAATHCPSLHVSFVGHVPHDPPHPSGPHFASRQVGEHPPELEEVLELEEALELEVMLHTSRQAVGVPPTLPLLFVPVSAPLGVRVSVSV